MASPSYCGCGGRLKSDSRTWSEALHDAHAHTGLHTAQHLRHVFPPVALVFGLGTCGFTLFKKFAEPCVRCTACRKLRHG